MTDEALALFIGGPLDGQRRRVPAEHDRYHHKGAVYEAWDIPAPAGRPPVRVFAPAGSRKEDVFWTLVVGFSAERAVAAAGRPWEAEMVVRYVGHSPRPLDPYDYEARPRWSTKEDSFIEALLESGILKK